MDSGNGEKQIGIGGHHRPKKRSVELLESKLQHRGGFLFAACGERILAGSSSLAESCSLADSCTSCRRVFVVNRSTLQKLPSDF